MQLHTNPLTYGDVGDVGKEPAGTLYCAMIFCGREYRRSNSTANKKVRKHEHHSRHCPKKGNLIDLRLSR